MGQAKLTKTVVEGAATADRDAYLWDTQLTGFGVKITPGGGRIYLVQYRPKGNAKTRRYNLGRHGAPHTTESARTAAAALLARVRLGVDPFAVDQARRRAEAEAAAAQKAIAAKAVREAYNGVVAEYIRRYAKPKNRTWAATERALLSSDLSGWADRPVSSITQQDVLKVTDAASDRSPATARLLFAHLRKFFAWCVERLYITTSPCTGLRSPSPLKARDRVLTDAEVARLWWGLEELGEPFGPLIKLLILTAQRREEVTGMRWSEVDLQRSEWHIPAERTKNGQAHAVDLSSQSLAILTQLAETRRRASRRDGVRRPAVNAPRGSSPDLIFTATGVTPVSGHSKAKARLDELVGLAGAPLGMNDLAPWRVHDLRRTAATGMARLGYNPHVIEAVLNHRSGVRGGLVAVYQHYDHRPERRAALQAWGAHVLAVVEAGRGRKTTAERRDKRTAGRATRDNPSDENAGA